MPVLASRSGTDINYSDHGEGPPLLLIHGWLMSSRVWHYQEPLSACLRVIAPDLRGHGLSTAAGFSYDGCLDDIRELLDHLGIERAILAGWSMGSQVAIRAALTMGERVSGLILVGGTPRFCSADDYPFGLPRHELKGMELRIRRNYLATAGNFFNEMFSLNETEHLDMNRIIMNTTGRFPSLETALKGIESLAGTDLRSDVSRIPHRTLLVHGSEDRICPYGASRFMAEKIPSSHLLLFPEAGHAPFMTAHDRFNNAILEFAQGLHG